MRPPAIRGIEMKKKESMEVARMQKRKLCPTRRQGNRWDQYGESSSASPSETDGMSDSSMVYGVDMGSV